MYLSDEENIQLLMQFKEILVKAMENEPREDRRRRLISLIDSPEV